MIIVMKFIPRNVWKFTQAVTQMITFPNDWVIQTESFFHNDLAVIPSIN